MHTIWKQVLTLDNPNQVVRGSNAIRALKPLEFVRHMQFQFVFLIQQHHVSLLTIVMVLLVIILAILSIVMLVIIWHAPPTNVALFFLDILETSPCTH